jgi:hypothetical protein
VRWSAPLDLAGLSMRGYVAPAGPVLSATAWDDVLVTEAVSDDGVTLRLSVRPWGGRVERAELVFAQLRPGVTYVIDGAGAPIEMRADDQGLATAELDLAGPLRLTVRAAEGAA